MNPQYSCLFIAGRVLRPLHLPLSPPTYRLQNHRNVTQRHCPPLGRHPRSCIGRNPGGPRIALRVAPRASQAQCHVRRRPEMPAPGPRHPAASVLGPGRSRRRGPFQWNPEPPPGGRALGRSRAAGDAGLGLHARFNFTRVPAVTDAV